MNYEFDDAKRLLDEINDLAAVGEFREASRILSEIDEAVFFHPRLQVERILSEARIMAEANVEEEIQMLEDALEKKYSDFASNNLLKRLAIMHFYRLGDRGKARHYAELVLKNCPGDKKTVRLMKKLDCPEELEDALSKTKASDIARCGHRERAAGNFADAFFFYTEALEWHFYEKNAWHGISKLVDEDPSYLAILSEEMVCRAAEKFYQTGDKTRSLICYRLLYEKTLSEDASSAIRRISDEISGQVSSKKPRKEPREPKEPDVLQLANGHLKSGNYREAEELLHQAVLTFPHDSRYWKKLAKVHAKMKNAYLAEICGLVGNNLPSPGFEVIVALLVTVQYLFFDIYFFAELCLSQKQTKLCKEKCIQATLLANNLK
ncbi:MAG: tetratricopeptide repeat protein, partial [Candidatus Moranbacteria bacterium]|nr:tetratricopeptide repeat protein [Candidatus Moranbacteria bacterium]